MGGLIGIGMAGPALVRAAEPASILPEPLSHLPIPAAPSAPVAPVYDVAKQHARALAVAREQLGRLGSAIAIHDRVGVVDFAQPSNVPRFHFVDLTAGKVTDYFVTHGRGSDPQHDGWLKSFSNEPNSLATSRGAYRTSDFYWGKNGNSMRLDGLDPDNSHARERAIVIHGAWYADTALIAQQGKLGRSEGCFAFDPVRLSEILTRIGSGRLVFADRLA